MPADLQKAREIFLHAVGKLPTEQWGRYVAEACCGDVELERQVESLLQVHRDAGSFLNAPAAILDVTMARALSERPGVVIGPYTLREQIGEGGMGLVFVAEQHEPVRRKVALKVIKPGMDTREVIARFEAERQALALMDHPNIARVFDAGATESARPYFVMELVKGVPITQFCDENRLTTRQRLELFVEVCQAVQHAHQKGIIHRDVKPSNVLVTSHDGKPVVKVIDFGVAKAIGQQLTDRTIYTGLAQMVGTPLYMSPEQAGMSGLDVDTRTDIYSLGVLLYELLTGTTPFDKDRLQRAAFDEVRRIIREEEPQRPSTRISTTDASPSIAAQRHTEPAKLAKLVRGELDWIVMKALEKDRNRRYETANGFALDLQRYLSDEPVQACPPSVAYRFRKFARRNKIALTTAGLVSLALVVGTVASTWQAFRASAAEQLAESRFQDERSARKGEAEQRQLAQQHAREAEWGRKAAQEAQAREADQRSLAEARERLVREQELLARRRLYAAQINLSMQAFQAGDNARAVEILETQRPHFDDEDLRTFEWYYLWRQCYRDLESSVTLQRHAIYRVAFSPDGSLRAVASSDGTVTLYDTTTGQVRTTLRADETTMPVIAFSPDGTFLAQIIRSQMTRVILWDVATGREHAILSDTGDVTRMAFSPIGDTLAVSSLDGIVRMWDMAGARWKASFQACPTDRTRPPMYVPLAFSPDGKSLVTGTLSEHFKSNLWDVTQDPPQLKRQFPIPAISMAYSPDGKTLAFGDWGSVRLWDAHADPPTYKIVGVWGDCYDVAFSRDGKFLACGTQAKDVRLVEVATGKVRTFPHAGAVRSVAISPDGRRLASVSEDATLKVWRIDDNGDTDKLRIPDGAIAVACSQDSRLVATGGTNGQVNVHELATGRLVTTLQRNQNVVRDVTRVVAFSPNGRQVAAGAGNWKESCPDAVKIWDLTGAAEVITLPGLSTDTFALGYSPDGRLLATGSHDGMVRLWDASSSRLLSTAAIGGRRVMSLAFAPDGTMLISGGDRGVVHLWKIVERELRYPLTLQQTNNPWFQTYAVACSPDGRLAAAGNTDGSLSLWKLPDGQSHLRMKGHTNRIWSIAFLADSHTLVSSDNNGSVKFWDAITGQERMTVAVPANNLLAVVPDGHTLVVPAGDTLDLLRAAQDALAVAFKSELDLDDLNSPVARMLSGDRLWAVGRTQEARATYAEARARLAQLITHFSSVPDYRHEQARCNLRLSLLPTNETESTEADQFRKEGLTQIADLLDYRRQDFSRTFQELGESLMTAERYSDAERAFTLAIELRPDDSSGWLSRALLHHRTKHVEQAHTDYSRALELAPASSFIRNNLAWSLATDSNEKLRDPVRAVELARQAVELAPTQGNSWNTLGVALCRAGDENAAVVALTKSNDLLHGNQLSFNAFFLAICHWQLGDPVQGRQWLARANEWMEQNAPKDEELLRFRTEAESLLVNWETAVRAYTQALEKSPEKMGFWRGRAAAYVSMQMPDAALLDYTHAIEMAPDDGATPWCYAARADIYDKRHQEDLALSELSQAIERWPNLADAWAWRGSFHRDREHWDKVIADYSKVVELNPSYWPGWYVRGFAYSQLKQWNKALADYVQLVERNPTYAEHALGQFKAEGRHQEFESLLRRAVTVLEKYSADFPRDARYPNLLARVYADLGEMHHQNNTPGEAEKNYRLAIAIWTKRASESTGNLEDRQSLGKSCGALGKLLLSTNRLEEAKQALTKAVEASPDNATAWLERARVHMALQQPDKALLDFSKALELVPNAGDSPWWRMERASAYHALQQDDKALADLSQAIELSPQLWDARVWRANFHSALQHWEAATVDYSKAIELNASYGPAWLARGRASAHLRRWEQAVQDFSQAATLSPEDVVVQNELAWLLATCPDIKLRDPTRAVELAKKAVTQAPEAGQHWSTLGAAQYRAGDWRAAIEALQKSTELRQGGDAFDFLFLALAHWQMANKVEARTWYEKAAGWMKTNAKDNEEHRSLRKEAAELLKFEP